MSDKAEKQQLLRDPNIEPTNEIIAEGIGEAFKTYTRFIKELVELHGITLMDWRFYNDGKAWLSKGEYKWTTPRGANKVKPIFWLSIWDGFFRVSFFFSASIRDELLGLPISQEVKDVIKTTELMGKKAQFLPLIFNIESDQQLSDVYAVAQLRKEKVR